MRVWRICKARWASRAFDGEGARIAGGRWNHRGEAVVYAADSLALAALEMFVHVDPVQAPDDLVAIFAEIPDDASLIRQEEADLPRGWSRYRAPGQLADLGSAWLRSRSSLLLSVPSAVIPVERCVLINPAHPEFHRLVVGEARPFVFDQRMWKA